MAAMCSLFLLLLLSALLGPCSGQDTNLTIFKISPCTPASPDSVSRFKSDIYAVLPDLSNCSNASQAALDHGSIVSPPQTGTADTPPPLSHWEPFLACSLLFLVAGSSCYIANQDYCMLSS